MLVTKKVAGKSFLLEWITEKPMVDAEQLITLLEVVERGSVSAAAEHLCRGQSAISERLKKLVEYVGEPLYFRKGNGLVFTEAGELILPDIKRLEHALRDIESIIRRRQSGQLGDLCIVATSLLANYYLPPYLEKFRAVYPNINLYIKSGERYWDNVSIGSVDVFFYEGEVAPPDLPYYFETVRWKNDNRIVLGVPDGHPLARNDLVMFKDLQNVPIVWREPGSAIRRAIEREFRNRGVESRHFIEVADIQSVGIMVKSGLGVGFFDTRVLDQHPEWGIKKIPLEKHEIISVNFMSAPHISRRSAVLSKFLEIINDEEI